jgi:hypothetical protein
LQLTKRLQRGSLLKVFAEGKAILYLSDYCPESIRNRIESRATQVLSKLGTVSEDHQGIFFTPDTIVVESSSGKTRLRFNWKVSGEKKEEVMVTSDLTQKKEKKYRKHHGTPTTSEGT